MIARAATIADLVIGQEVIYVPSWEYRPTTAIHGTIESLYEVIASSSPSASFRPVKLASYALPIRFYVLNALYIIGS